MFEREEKSAAEFALDDYIKPKKFGSRFWRAFVIIFALISLILLYKYGIVDKSLSAEELKSFIDLREVTSNWIVKKRVNTESFKGVILVPSISFRIKNSGTKELQNIFFLGVFRFVNSPKLLGEGSSIALKKPLVPGKESKEIVISSQYGYSASSEIAFSENQMAWKRAYVEIYTRSSGSELVFLKSFYISRKIEGVDIDVKIL